MDTSQSASSGSAADAGAATATISTANPESEARLRALVAERGPALRVRLSALSDFDVSGHQLSATTVTLDLLDEDDTEGHSISLHFPSAQDAKHFEQRMIATGAIVGTLVIGGSGLALSQTLSNAPADVPTQTQVEANIVNQGGSDLVYPGAISPSTGGALTGKEEVLLSQMGGAADAAGTNPFPGIVSPSTGGTLTGKEQGLLTVIVGNASETGDVQVGASSTGDQLSGKQEGVLDEISK